MKTKNLVLGTLILSAMLSSCYKRNGWPVKGQGANVSETRSVETFDRISLSSEGEVEFTQDSVFSLEVEGQQNILAVLRTEVKGSELKIWFTRNVREHHTVHIRVHAPALRGMSISGSGNIRVTNKINVTDLECNISGSGNMNVPLLEATHLTSKISGSGNIRIDNGNANSQQLSISGSGDISSENLLSLKTTIKISGSGNVSVNVTEELSVDISGSGDVRYKGKPAVDTDISGSGKLIRIQ
jgi:hypothetical protein